MLQSLSTVVFIYHTNGGEFWEAHKESTQEIDVNIRASA